MLSALTKTAHGVLAGKLYVVVLVDNHWDPWGRCRSAWGLSLYVRYGDGVWVGVTLLNLVLMV